MSYPSGRKWQAVKVVLTGVGASRLYSQILPSPHPHPVGVHLHQPVGVSLKYEHGKFIFDTKVVSLEVSPMQDCGGTIVLEVPDRIEMIHRRSYFRVELPMSLKVNVELWHHGSSEDESVPPRSRWRGKLTDISAGGAQVVIAAAQRARFKKGHCITMRFVPMPYEPALEFDAQVRTVLPTADGQSVCFGLQIVGLEASRRGRQILSRLVEIVERYYHINECGARTEDFNAAVPSVS
jgi:hypothetical protein